MRRQTKMSRYLIQSKTTGEVFACDGKYACGPLHHSEWMDHATNGARADLDLEDFNYDDAADPWLVQREGRVLADDDDAEVDRMVDAYQDSCESGEAYENSRR